MKMKRAKALTFVLIGLGIAIAALGTTLFLTAPESRSYFGHMGGLDYRFEGAREQAQDGRGETLPPLGPRFGQGRFDRGRFGMMAGHGFPGGILLPLALFALVIYAVRRRHDHLRGTGACPSREEDAVSILRRDFAEGKIGEDDYRKRLAALESK